MKKICLFLSVLMLLAGCSNNDMTESPSESYQSIATTELTPAEPEQSLTIGVYLLSTYTDQDGVIVFQVFDPETLQCKEIFMEGTQDEDLKNFVFNGMDYVSMEVQQKGDKLLCSNNAYEIMEPPTITEQSAEEDGVWNFTSLIGHKIDQTTKIGKKLTDIYLSYDFIVSSLEEYEYLPPDKINKDTCMMYTKYAIEDKSPSTEDLWDSLKEIQIGDRSCYVFDADTFLDILFHYFPGASQVDFKTEYLDKENHFYYNPDENQFVFNIGGRGGVRFPPFLVEFENLPDDTIRFVFMESVMKDPKSGSKPVKWEYTVKLLDDGGFQFLKIDLLTV